MKRRLAIGQILLLSVVAASAQASLIAGWDFTQYFVEGRLAPAGTTLSANYSSLDPTFNAGAESAAFGTMYVDGSFGSAVGNFLPTAGSLQANRDAPVEGLGDIRFDSLWVLKSEGQANKELMSMTAIGAARPVFAADLSSVPDQADDWSVSFGGKTLGGTSTVGVEFSTDGSSWSSFGSVQLDDDPATDDRFVVQLATTRSATGYVRLTLNDSAGQPVIDNVAITATPLPEPVKSMLVAAGIAVLFVLRSARPPSL